MPYARIVRATVPDVIFLISENPSAHGVFDSRTEVKRKVFCQVGSVGYSEFYSAKNAGIEPSVVFTLDYRDEYKGEKLIEWKGQRFRVIRTFAAGQSIEITCEEATNDK